ncbi:MAG TPA: SRPBCC domain-containing protein [Alphaproteobacteria bacterium]|jgi:carbon monoxide dehydrogenase subunit G|nr:SRPBCC domain-containing protein [Alphaproteobacteria bacterium]
MNVRGEITVKAPRAAVFEKLRDAPFFASCVEGVRDLLVVDERHYTAVMETRVAYMKFTFKVTVELVEAVPPERIEARIEGTPLGIVGRLNAASRTSLSEAGDETRIAYAVDVSLTGKLGSLGAPVLKSKAREMERLFAANLQRAFAPASAEAAP